MKLSYILNIIKESNEKELLEKKIFFKKVIKSCSKISIEKLKNILSKDLIKYFIKYNEKDFLICNVNESINVEFKHFIMNNTTKLLKICKDSWVEEVVEFKVYQIFPRDTINKDYGKYFIIIPFPFKKFKNEYE